MGVRDVVFTILAIDEASRTFDKIGRHAEETGAKFGVLGKAAGMGLAAVGVGAAAAIVEGVKLGASFQSTMAQLNTQAHVPQAQVDKLGQGVLHLAGQVGTGPDSLAEALYHIESSFASTGITGAKAMDLLKTSAEGAKIGHADLVDVTNALDAAVASGIPGAQNFNQAMGALNATVGAGDMHMQDLADAFSTGLPSIARAYGVSLRDVGGALATFGDLNIRGQVAATDLRMSIMDLTKQSKPGEAALKAIGISAGQLGHDMQKGGLTKALDDLHQHLDKAGIKGARVGRVLEDAFTKKSSAPLAILMNNLDRYHSKLKEVDKGAHDFGSSWAAQQKTFTQQWDQFKAASEAALTQLGLKLLPMLTKALPVATKIATAAIDGISKAIDVVGGWLGQARDWFAKTFGNPDTASKVNGLRQTIATAFNSIRTAVLPVLQQIGTEITTQLLPAFTAFVQAMVPVVSFLVTHLGPVVTIIFVGILTTIRNVLTVVSGVLNVFAGLFTGDWSRLWTGVKQILGGMLAQLENIMSTGWAVLTQIVSQAGPAIWAAVVGIGEGIRARLLALVGEMAQIGSQIMQGLVGGITSAAGNVTGAIGNVVGGAISSAKSMLGISSPSRVFRQIGAYVGEGFIQGVIASKSRANTEMSHLMDLVTRTGETGMERFVTKMRGKMLGLWTAKASTDQQLKGATSHLHTLQGDYAKQQASVRDGVLSNGDVTKGAGTDYGSIVFHLQNVVAQTRQFYGVVGQLRKMGLGKGLIDQLIAAGPDQGLPYAQSILAQGKAGVSQLNSLTGQLGAAGGALGKVSADNMYGAGIASVDSLIRGLKAREAKLSKAMETLARGMVATLHKHWGIPSGVALNAPPAHHAGHKAHHLSHHAHHHTHVHFHHAVIGDERHVARVVTEAIKRTRGRGTLGGS